MSFLLLLAKIDLVCKKQGCKRDLLVAYSFSCIKIVLTLATKVVVLYIQALIIQVFVIGLKDSILEDRIYLTIFLTFYKQF